MPVTSFIPLEEQKSVKGEEVGQAPAGRPVQELVFSITCWMHVEGLVLLPELLYF